MALLTAIKASYSQEELASSSKLVNKENRELKRSSHSINYDLKGDSSSQGKVNGGYSWIFMKPKLSWNVRGLNEGDKHLRVRNLIKHWKAYIICLQESKLELICISVVCSLWGCQHVDGCYLTSRAASGRILLIWDRRVVEKIKECWGVYCCLLF